MRHKKIILLCFGLVVLLQLWTPASMIWNRESVLKTGSTYKFRAAPVDPTDPFRGKYIVLSFSESSFVDTAQNDWASGDPVYVALARDAAGFAVIQSLHRQPPRNGVDFVATTVSYIGSDSTGSVVVEWPFNRFYMEESKAYPAEQLYVKSLADSNNVTYALVKVKKGEAVLQNVFINNKPIATY